MSNTARKGITEQQWKTTPSKFIFVVAERETEKEFKEQWEFSSFPKLLKPSNKDNVLKAFRERRHATHGRAKNDSRLVGDSAREKAAGQYLYCGDKLTTT